MERLAKKLASNISVSLGYDEEQQAVIAYGLSGMFQISLTIMVIMVLGFIVGTPIESAILCFSSSILRKYSGGVHAAAAWLCIFISALNCTLFALAAKGFLANIYHPTPMLIALILIYFFSYVLIYKHAPVASPNKPIKTERKIKRMRRGSFTVLSVYLAISIAFYLLAQTFPPFAPYGICLLFGVWWQVFMLTAPGAAVIGWINQRYANIGARLGKEV